MRSPGRTAVSEGTEPQRTAYGLAGNAQRRRPLVAAAVPPAGTGVPVQAPRPAAADFGPQVRVFDPATPAGEIQAVLDAAAAADGAGGRAFLFAPGSYDVDVPLGPHTSVAGLGLHPDDVTINGEVRVAGRDRPGGGAGSGLGSGGGRSVENLAVVPPDGVNRWAAGAGSVLRRVHVRGRPALLPETDAGGWVADSLADEGGALGPPRTGWDGAAGRALTGVPGAAGHPSPATTLTTAPVGRERPFLYVDEQGGLRVLLPALRRGEAGPAWADGTAPGSSVPLDRFFVARPGDSVRAINRALAQGLHLLLTPGMYRPADTLKVKWPGTVVLGLGFPVLAPRHGGAAMAVANARGVRLAGLVFAAGPVESRVLLEVGTGRGGRTDPADPASVQDVLFRVGGTGRARVAAALTVGADHVLLDHVRVGHADGAQAPSSAAEAGVVVNGDHVVATGLTADRCARHGVLWNGAYGHADGIPQQSPYGAAI